MSAAVHSASTESSNSTPPLVASVDLKVHSALIQIQQCLHVLKTFVLLSCLVLTYLWYVLVADPLLFLIVQSRPLQLQVQGYLVEVIEVLVDKIFQRVFTYEVDGQDLIDNKCLAVVLCNHQSFLDYFTMMHFSSRSGLDNSNFFFAHKHCVRLPSLPVLLSIWRGQTDWEVPRRALAEVFTPILESPWRSSGGKWVVLFPEVIPWSRSTMVMHRHECEKNGAPKFNNLLYPTFPGFLRTIEHLRDVPQEGLMVYELAVTYIDKSNGNSPGVPNWRSLLLGERNWVIHIDVRKQNASQLASKEKHLKSWLEKEWVLMDTRISETKKALAAHTTEKNQGDSPPH